MTYNKTQLNPETTFERHVFHRDQFAHYLRWTHLLKKAELGMNILDVGCGSGNLAEVLYRNRYKANAYIGLDIRKQIIEKNKEKFKDVPWISFNTIDVVLEKLPDLQQWDIIACFEVAEHLGKENIELMLENIKNIMSQDTLLLFSTPCFDPSVGAADNHIIDGQVGESTYEEMKEILSKRFKIIDHYGTFASKKDYKKLIPADLKPYFDRLNEYYDDNLISNLMAPLFPANSRNVLWEVKK